MELTVQVVSFGSAWWVRPGWDDEDPERYTQHAAYFNTTGVHQGRSIHTGGPVRGLVRFNVSSGLDPHRTRDNVGRIFSFRSVERYRDTNRLLAVCRAPKDAAPTHFLVAMDSALHGAISRRSRWCTGDIQMIAMSRYRDKQEALLLVATGARVYTTAGGWTVAQEEKGFPRLTLVDEPEVVTSRK